MNIPGHQLRRLFGKTVAHPWQRYQPRMREALAKPGR
jgi:hypothetical protein